MKTDLKHLSQFRVREGDYGSEDAIGNYGAFKIPLRQNTWACCIVADGDETGWEHVSVHVVYRNQQGKYVQRTPSWEEMANLKALFWDDQETVIQFHPPKSTYVNLHEHCLHLWRPEKIDIPLPPIETV